MPYNMIKYNKEDGLAFITFNRPDKRNALNHEMMKEIETALGDAENDQDISAVILTGGDKYFISGTDMDFLLGEEDNQKPQKIYKIHRQTQSLYRYLTIYTKPTIAVIAGYAFGGGLELALCCDFRIATNDAKLGTPEIKVGIIPGAGGTQRLTRLMGVTKAKELILTGDPISGDEAYQFGLLNRVVDNENLMEEAKTFAGKFRSLPGYSIEMGKAIIDTGLNMGLKEALELERIAFSMLYSTEDQKEGLKAFLEKRAPKFKGK
jgi:enoyl-CoA hydratase